MAVSKYAYPKLNRSEIITILAQYNIATITEDDFTNPNPDFISELYNGILVHLDLLLDEDNEQLDFTALANLDNPDSHADSLRAVKLYHKIKEVLSALECPMKFTFFDLLRPGPNRTEFFLSALLNFCLDREARMRSITEIAAECEALEMERRELQENTIAQLELKIAECNEAREREMPLVQEVEAQVKELRQTIPTLNNKQVSLKTSLKKSREKIEEMDQKISQAEFTLVQNVQENASLRSKIVQSPDKVQRALEEKKLAREEARNAERLAMQTFHEKTSLLEVYSKVHKKMSKHYKQMHDIQEQVNSAKSIEKDLKALKAKLRDDEVSEKSLEAKLVERQSKVEQTEELNRQLEKDCNAKVEEASKYLSSIKAEVDSKRCAMEMRERNVEAVLSEVDTINRKVTSVKESGAVKVKQLRLKCEEIVEELNKYANSIAHVIESGLKSQSY